MDDEILNDEKLEYVEEYMWAYDWWLTYKLKDENFKRHRMNKDRIISLEQIPEYGSLYCTTENWDKFINLRKIEND